MCEHAALEQSLDFLFPSNSGSNYSFSHEDNQIEKGLLLISDRPILIFYNRYRYRYLYVYVTDNRYSEPIFIYCYKVNK